MLKVNCLAPQKWPSIQKTWFFSIINRTFSSASVIGTEYTRHIQTCCRGEEARPREGWRRGQWIKRWRRWGACYTSSYRESAERNGRISLRRRRRRGRQRDNTTGARAAVDLRQRFSIMAWGSTVNWIALYCAPTKSFCMGPAVLAKERGCFDLIWSDLIWYFAKNIWNLLNTNVKGRCRSSHLIHAVLQAKYLL